MGSSIEPHAVLHNTLDAATRLMNAEASSVALIDDTGTHLVFVETTDPDPTATGCCG